MFESSTPGYYYYFFFTYAFCEITTETFVPVVMNPSRYSSSAHGDTEFVTPPPRPCMHSDFEKLWLAELLVCNAPVTSHLMATVCGPKLPPFPIISIRECQGAGKMFRKSNVRWLWHASLQQLLQYFATLSPEMLLVEKEGREAGCSASQQPLLCRIHAVKL